MRILVSSAMVTLVLLLAVPAMSQDFDKGHRAYKTKNYAAALDEWWPLAAQGNARAQAWVGFMYDKGYGVQQDDIEALTWYLKAVREKQAHRGNAYAAFHLGEKYREGRGVRRDNVIAYMWYRVAGTADGDRFIKRVEKKIQMMKILF